VIIAQKAPQWNGAIREAQAEAVLHVLRNEPRAWYLSDLRSKLKFRGMTRAEVDRAVNALAENGWLTVAPSQYGGLYVRLIGSGR
jgi:DNA-binding IclR family transcriptional regulator